MHSSSKLAKISALALALTLNFAGVSFACGPDYPEAVLFSWNHPDLPLQSFAGGNLGVVFNTWAKSYLCVVYRYLDGKPLNSAEQNSVDSMWASRLKSEAIYLFDDDYYPAMSYFELRAKNLHIKNSIDSSKVQSKKEITDGAFHLALKTLRALIKKYGQSSSTVKQWLVAQDCVFGANAKYQISVPSKLPADVDSKLSVYRDYQIAAADFYLNNNDKAQAEFARLALSKSVPEIQKVSAYMEARVAASQMFGASDNPHDVANNLHVLNKYKNRVPDLQSKLDIVDLESLQISQNVDPKENLQRIVQSILKEANPPKYNLGDLGLGRNIWDLTYILDDSDEREQIGVADKNKYDLIDWLNTVSSGTSDFYMTMYPSPEDEKAMANKRERKRQHALEKWRSSHSKAWLVATMLCAGLRGDDVQDVQYAAEQLQPEDPAYLTARFYLIDRLIQQKKFSEARAKLQNLNYGNMSLTTLNLFKAQQIATCESIDKYFASAVMPVSASSSNLLLVDDTRWRQWNAPRKQLATFDTEIGRDLDRYLPFQKWAEFSRRSDLPCNLRERILCAVWIKSHLLGKKIDEIALLEQLKPFCSKTTSEKISKYEKLKASSEKQFLFAQILLDNFGMSPYVKSGLPRFADKINTFNYYQHNFWLPLIAQPTAEEQKIDDDENRYGTVVERMNVAIAQLLKQYYSTQKIDGLLSAQQVKEAGIERKVMEEQHPSRFLGGIVLKYAKEHPGDPDVPAYLFKIVKLPRWSGETQTGSEYSRTAYFILHNKYPANRWTKSATCYY